MKVTVLCVGRPRGLLAPAIADYEKRASRYFRFETIEVKETPGRGASAERIMKDEGERLLARSPDPTELVALHRGGKLWTSDRFATHLSTAGLRGSPGFTFVIGGAFGLHAEVLDRADLLISLSGMTLPHEMARLFLTEQIYRAGTIARGEAYHKGIDA